MYTRGSPISLNTNELVSLSPENLSVVGSLSEDNCRVAYVSTHKVVIANVGKRYRATKAKRDSIGVDVKGSYESMGEHPIVLSFSGTSILSCKLIEVGRKPMLVIMSDSSICLKSIDTMEPIWEVPVQDFPRTPSKFNSRAQPKAFARGCTQFQSDDKFMAIGLSNGSVAVVDLRNGDILHSLQGWCSTSANTPVVSVASPRSGGACDPYLASVNESNEVLVYSKSWSLRHEMALTGMLPEMSDLATCLTCIDSAVIIGFLSGAVRVCDASTGTLIYDIAAHGRRVTSVSSHPSDEDRFCSCAEDQCLNVWSMPKSAVEASVASRGSDSTSRVELISHHCVENAMLTGSTWDGEGTLLTTSYDTDSIETYRAVPARKM